MLSSVPLVPFHGAILEEQSTAGFRLTERTYPSGLQIPMHAHEHAFFGFTVEGHYSQFYGLRTREFRPWTITFQPSGETHSSSYATGARALYVEIAPAQLRQIRECSPFEEVSLSLAGGRPSWCAARLYHEFHHADELSPLVLEGLVLQLFAEIFRKRKAAGGPAWLRRAKEMIRARFAEALTLAEIANEVGVHPVHLAHEYRRQYRCTVGEQIRQLRIEYACKQITETNCPLADVALAAGFSDQSHLTVAFRNSTGMTPSAYRALLRRPNCTG